MASDSGIRLEQWVQVLSMIGSPRRYTSNAEHNTCPFSYVLSLPAKPFVRNASERDANVEVVEVVPLGPGLGLTVVPSYDALARRPGPRN